MSIGVLDVWAPGVSILSSYIGSTTATARLSGTSMATPYVAGILAVVLGEYGQVTPVRTIIEMPERSSSLFALI
jgi:subtilisin family serine protease